MSAIQPDTTNPLDIEQTCFNYNGINILGHEPTKQYIYAASEEQAEAILGRAKIEVETLSTRRRKLSRRKKHLTLEQLGTFAIQLAERTKASDPIPKAIQDIARSSTNPLLREALLDVWHEIKKESLDIDQAFAVRSDVFPEAFRHIIRVGTTKGDPSDMLAKYGERQLETAENISKFYGALIYPSVVLSLATAIAFILCYFILPSMEQMYMALLDPSSGAKLPWLTRGLLGFSHILVSWYGGLGLITSFFSFVFGFRWLRTPAGRDWYERKSIHWPLVGNLIRQFNAAHVVDLMSILAPVVTPQEFLKEAAAASLNVVYRETIESIRESCRSGAIDLTTAVTPYAYLFGDEFAAAVSTGEQTGRLAKQLENYSQLLDRRVQNSTAKLAKTVEPLTLVIAGLAIGLIVIAAYWPLFSLVGEMANKH